jgi:urea transport system substrate-binding protein
MPNRFTDLTKQSKINYKLLALIFVICVLFIIFIYYSIQINAVEQHPPIKVGVLFSSTGAMANLEQPVLRATLLAIEEINNKGGVRGSLIEPVIYDPGSDWNRSAQLASKMIVEDHVVAIFGSYTSASRKEVKEVVEKYDNLLIYSVGYEGIEESKNIIYLGMSPNQQLIPAVTWMLEQQGKKVYLVGSDYIWPRVSNEIIAHEIMMLGGETVGSHFILLGSRDVDTIIDDIIAKKPDFVCTTLVGISNTTFINRLYNKIPLGQRPLVMSFAYIDKMNARSKFYGLNWVGSYYRGLNIPENKAFLNAYETKYGSSEEVDDPTITSYTGVYLWAQAVLITPTATPEKVRDSMLRQSIASPAGVIYIDPINAHAWRYVFIERINQQGMREIVWTSSVPIEPIVFPEFKSKAEWSMFEYKLFVKWGNSWENK